MILENILINILITEKLTADQILIMELIQKKNFLNLSSFLEIEKQRSILLQNLIRKGYLEVYDEGLSYEILENIYVTDLGENILLNVKKSFEELTKDSINFSLTDFEKKFEEFWNLFPSSDKYMYFPRSRVLKTELEKCKKLYRKLLDDYKHEDILEALKYEIKMRENNSLNSKTFSDFKYMKASSTWLNNKEFLSIQEIMKDDNIEKEDPFSKVV